MNAHRIVGALSLLMLPGLAGARPIDVDLKQHAIPFGAATVDVHKGVLTASNITNPGEDGVRADVLAATAGLGTIAWRFNLGLPSQVLREGASIDSNVSGTRDGEWSTSTAFVRVIDGRMRLSAVVYYDALIQIEIQDRTGKPVYIQNNLPPDKLDIEVDPLPNWLYWYLYLSFDSMAPNGENICSWTYDFGGNDFEALQFRDGATGEPLARGTRIIVREMVPRGLNIVTDATISGHDLEPFQISGMTMNAPPSCPVDVNHDGAVNSQDFFDFLTSFFANDPAADFNADSAVNSQDFFDFIGAFFDGC